MGKAKEIDYPRGLASEYVRAALDWLTARQMQNYHKRFGDFTNHFGEIVEYRVTNQVH